ncbi:MAG: hypothetical protein ACTSWW_00100 [Promethearchaeota archaeon]
MSNISVRIDPQLKKEMEKLPHLKWNAIIQGAIKGAIAQERDYNLAKAVLLNEKVRKKAPVDFDSGKIIQKFRAER